MSLLMRLLALLLLVTAAHPARAVDTDDLLPVDQAFVLTARAEDRNLLDVQWQIAPGYYLYRHRARVLAHPDFQAGELQLPAGTPHTDEFFGPVETYRQQLHATLPGRPAETVNSVTVEVQYQGCADLGVCYPPQKRQLQVNLPKPAAVPAMSSNAGFSLTGGPARGGLRLPGMDDSRALPLPAEQAFQVEAVVNSDQLLLRFQPADGYYLYRDRSAFRLEGPPGVGLGTPRWPVGTAHDDAYFGQTTVYFTPINVTLPLQREQRSGGPATLIVTFQGCQSEGICYPPMTRRLAVDIPVASPIAPRQTAQADTAPALPRIVSPDSDTTHDDLSAPPGSLILRDHIRGDPLADNTQRSQPPQDSGHTLWLALLLALLGGLILNLMPCVLPVLSLKVLSLAHSGQTRAHARAHALWYTAGVLVAFGVIGITVIGLRAAGQAAGWGFQLQQPLVVAALATLMFAMGLSLSGVFTLGAGSRLGNLAAQRHGPAADFLTGVLACIVASPCIAPFMGGALAYAVTAPPALALLVFLMLGLGLSLPFLLIGFLPALADRLPRPGAWMETLKQLLAFPMYLTAVWLAWVLGKQRGVDGMALLLIGMAILALGLWWLERSRWQGKRLSSGLAALVIAAALWPIWAVNRLPATTASVSTAPTLYQTYDPVLLDRLRADNRVIFVNMTADWCVTCKANEHNVIQRPAFAELLSQTNAAYLRGDWTNVDPTISAFLQEHHAVGVPLYVVYGPGTPPTVLPVVLTQAIVEDALRRAAR